jgi:hypothetical protein
MTDDNVSSIEDNELLCRAVKCARKGRGYQPRWVCVMHAFVIGPTYARQLCLRFNLDPYEKVRAGSHTPQQGDK